MRGTRLSFLALSTLLAAVSLTPAASAAGGGAVLSLASSNGQMTQTSDTEWTLSKTGSVDEANSTVAWTITATEGATTPGHLAIGGQMTLSNTGSGGATLGNVVANLQTKSGTKWVTRSSDVADATNGNAATAAKVVASASSEHKSSFTENAVSGELGFMDAGTNATVSLVPQVTIGPGQSTSLLFHASFDNDVLRLATGTSTRAEIIVTFGNATSNPASAANVDINGNGVIDPDEARVRSVPTRLGLIVPAQTDPGTPTLSDTLSDITTTSTVTFSNAQFDLGATSGTVTVGYDAGFDGGTIANCAHLRGGSPPNDLDLEACDTQTIEAPPSCTPGAPGCGWEAADMLTFGQTQWGDSASTAGAVLAANYNRVYSSTGGVLEVGISGAGGFSMMFTVANSVLSYLPAVGTVSALTSDLIDPVSSSSGDFGGEVVAMALNIDFSDAGAIAGTSPLGDLRICGFSPLPAVNGMTVRQFAAMANQLLGGGSGSLNVSQAAVIASFVNAAFTDGNPTVFAQDNLIAGACPWKPGDMLTFNQTQWGDRTSAGGVVLGMYMDSVYAASAGVLEAGLPGATGFSMLFTGSDAVIAYLPAIGPVGQLTSDLLNPTSSSSGALGGEVVALELNIDFSDADVIGGSAPLRFGDLRICNFALFPVLNGQTVRQFASIANMILGGGSGPISANQAAAVSSLINGAFVDGSPSVFAQDDLVAGAC